MSEISLEVGKKAQENINKLMSHYHVPSSGDLISKALQLLWEVAEAENNKSDLIVRSHGERSKIYIRRTKI